jgi:gliding motility-associated-like protein
MYNANIRSVGLLFFIYFILRFSSSSYAQTIERIEINDTLTNISNLAKSDFRAFISKPNQFTILINDGFQDRFHLIKLDSSNRVEKAVTFYTSQLNEVITIQGATYHQGYIYFITKQLNGIVGKMDLNLNLIWAKKVSSMQNGNVIYLKSICGLNDRIYVSGNAHASTFVGRFTPEGQFIQAIELFDNSYADSVFLRDGGGFQNMISDGQFLYVLSQQFEQFTSAPMHLFKFDPWFYYPITKTFYRTGGYQDEIKGFDLIERDSTLKIEIRTLGTPRYMSIKYDKDFNLIDWRNWDVLIQNNTYAPPDLFRLKNGNEFYYIFPIDGFGQKGTYLARSYLGWSFQSRFFNDVGNTLVPDYKYFGFTRNGGDYKFLRSFNTYGIGGNTTIEILETGFPPFEFPCSVNSPSQLRNDQQFSVIEMSPSVYNDRFVNFQLTDVWFPNRPVSAIQYPFCGYSQIDSCNLISSKIVAATDSVCSGTKLRFSGISYLGNQFSWNLNGQFYSNNREIEVHFPNPGQYNLKLFASNSANSSCQAVDSLQITVIPAPVLLSTDTTMCKGDTLFISSMNSTDVLWTSVNPIDCDTCTSTFIVAQAMDRVSWSGSSNSVCSISSDFQLSLFPTATGQLSGPQTICPGSDSILLILNTDSNHSSLWWVDTLGSVFQENSKGALSSWGPDTGTATVFVNLIDTNSCIGDTIFLELDITKNLKPLIRTATDKLCFSDKDSALYSMAFPNSESIYLWNIENGIKISSDSASIILVSWDSIGYGMLKAEEFIQTSFAQCYGLDSLQVNILPNPNTDLNLRPANAEICQGEQIIFEIEPGWTNSNYKWFLVEQNRILNTFQNQILVSGVDTGNLTIKVVEFSAQGCPGVPDSVLTKINPLTNPEIIANDSTICVNNSQDQIYNAIGFENSNYQWFIRGGKLLRRQGVSEMKVDWDPIGIKFLKVLETSKEGCKGDTAFKEFRYDFSKPVILNVERNPFDTTIIVKYDLEYHWMNPEDYIHILRKELSPVEENWDTLGLLFGHLNTYLDRNANPQKHNVAYRVDATNLCNESLSSEIHSTINLEAFVTFKNDQEEIELKWTPYDHWQAGIDHYEIYEAQDTILYLNKEVESNHSFVKPQLVRKNQCFRIKGLDKSGEHYTWSNEACIERSGLINIPNVVTANGDGLNDKLEITNLNSFINYRLRIYNRWGRLVFESSAYDSDWPGENIEAGVYYYYLNISNDAGQSPEYSGWVELLR